MPYVNGEWIDESLTQMEQKHGAIPGTPSKTSLTKMEQKYGAIPGTQIPADQIAPQSEMSVRSIEASKPAYQPQFGPVGAISQTQKYKEETADAAQRRAIGDTQVPTGPQGRATGTMGAVKFDPSVAAKYGYQPDQAATPQSASDKAFAASEKYMDMEGQLSPITKMLMSKMYFQRGKELKQGETDAGRGGEQLALEKERQKGALAGVEREYQLKQEAEAKDPLTEAKQRLAGLTADATQQQVDKEKRRMALIAGMNDPDNIERQAVAARQYKLEFGGRDDRDPVIEKSFQTRLENAADQAERESILDEYSQWKNSRAEGGVIEAYADGGAIGRQQPSMETVHPLVAQYGQYLQAASSAGVPPVPLQQYLSLLQTTRGAMQQAPATYADGGEVEDEMEEGAIPVAGKLVRGPGTETSDSIPAVINGKRPAALSDGEYVIPAHIVRAKGTEFFDKLLAQYEDKESGDGE